MKRIHFLGIMGFIVGGLVLSCGQGQNGLTDNDDNNGGAPVVVGQSLASLKKADTCDDVLAQLKQHAIKEMKKHIKSVKQEVMDLKEHGCRVYEAGAGGDANGGPVPEADNGGSSSRADAYSKTNVQVEGVDEADFVKNDDKYIYVLANKKFQIIDAWPAADTKKIATFEIEGQPKRMYVYKDRAVIYSSLERIRQSYEYYDDGPHMSSITISAGGSVRDGGSDCTYGYDCDFSGDGRKLKITVLDITDKTRPRLLREITFSGSYINSRRIGKIVHTVVLFSGIAMPGLKYWPDELGSYWELCDKIGNKTGDKFPYTDEEIDEMFDKLIQENIEKINKTDITDFLPSIKDVEYVDGKKVVNDGLLDNCKGFYISQENDGRSLLSVVSFDMTQIKDIAATTIIGRAGAVYASKEALYIAQRHYKSMMRQWYFDDKDINEATTIHKFILKPGSIHTQYAGSGAIKGRVLNQFSMDEYDGYLRIATTSGHVPSPKVYSTVAVLKQTEDGKLAVVGMVDHIAPSEDIRSCRFVKDRAFLVTFKKTDPLFTLDMSDPYNPRILGELKIPGYSTYMHMLDDQHILSIGFDAEDKGNFAWFAGIMLQIFDVSDLENPKLLHKEVIGTRGSTSDAATDHLAFTYFPQRKLLGVPIVICEGGHDGMYGSKMTFSGLLVYKVDIEDGFDRLGGVPHSGPDQSHNACSNWWTRSNSHVKRSVFMSDKENDFVYSIALDKIEVSNLDDLEHPIAEVDLQ